MKNTLIANVAKNLLVILAAVLLFDYVRSQVLFVKGDPLFFQTFLISISILILCAMFGCFSFRYKDTAKGNMWLGYLVTGLFMFGIGIMFEMLIVLINIPIFTILSAVMYLGVMLYDFWDFYQLKEK